MLINLRNAMMAGRRIPYDAELEYLESTGTQWIDTGIRPDQSTGLQVRYSVSVSNNEYLVAGIRSDDTLGRWGCNDTPTRIIWQWGSSYGTALNVARIVGGVVDYEINYMASGMFSVTNANGTTNTDALSTLSTASTNLTAYLFAWNNRGTVGYNLVGKIYSAKISVGNVLVRDFIPVRKGTVGYLYDRVSKRLFGNAGTGDFVLGPDVVPVEYIESHGTEWIDTGFKADRSTVVKCALSVVSRTTNGYVVWGAAKGDGSSGLYDAVALAEKYNSPSTLFLLDTYNNNNAQSISYGQDLLVECVLSDGSITINGTTTSHNYYTINKTADYPIWVFGENLAGNLFRPSQIKMRFLQILQSGVHVRSFRPVRVGNGSTWAGAMMDVLTRRIYRNAGTGAFTYGNDLRYPIPSS